MATPTLISQKTGGLRRRMTERAADAVQLHSALPKLCALLLVETVKIEIDQKATFRAQGSSSMAARGCQVRGEVGSVKDERKEWRWT